MARDDSAARLHGCRERGLERHRLRAIVGRIDVGDVVGRRGLARSKPIQCTRQCIDGYRIEHRDLTFNTKWFKDWWPILGLLRRAILLYRELSVVTPGVLAERAPIRTPNPGDAADVFAVRQATRSK